MLKRRSANEGNKEAVAQGVAEDAAGAGTRQGVASQLRLQPSLAKTRMKALAGSSSSLSRSSYVPQIVASRSRRKTRLDSSRQMRHRAPT